jgi:hypothetical protein
MRDFETDGLGSSWLPSPFQISEMKTFFEKPAGYVKY